MQRKPGVRLLLFRCVSPTAPMSFALTFSWAGWGAWLGRYLRRAHAHALLSHHQHPHVCLLQYEKGGKFDPESGEEEED